MCRAAHAERLILRINMERVSTPEMRARLSALLSGPWTRALAAVLPARRRGRAQQDGFHGAAAMPDSSESDADGDGDRDGDSVDSDDMDEGEEPLEWDSVDELEADGEATEFDDEAPPELQMHAAPCLNGPACVPKHHQVLHAPGTEGSHGLATVRPSVCTRIASLSECCARIAPGVTGSATRLSKHMKQPNMRQTR